MSSRYTYSVEQSVLSEFLKCNKHERDALLRLFSALCTDPHRRGDYVQMTAVGRQLEVIRSGKWLLTFWADHAVCEIRVVDLKRFLP